MRPRLKLSIHLLLFICLSPALVNAQSETAVEVGVPYERALTSEALDVYTVNVDDETFVYGYVDQKTVDVVVTLRKSDGSVLREFDGPGRGLEHFSFTAKESDVLRIEVTPFKNAEGDYTFVLVRREPVAQDNEGKIDQMMTAYSNGTTPGCAVGVYRDGEIVYSRAWGSANLTYAIPFTPETPCNIGSVSKQFTAFGIALLADAGKLSLDDDIRTHIPELPEFAQVTRIRNLLSHTGGYREVYNTFPLTGWDFEDALPRSEVIRMVQQQDELQFEIGKSSTYNNTAFILLSMVIERLTGKAFDVWMAENVFAPLGMTSTRFKMRRGQVITGAEQGYVPGSEGGFRAGGDFDASAGAGGIYTTIGDMAKWVHNFHTKDVGGRAVDMLSERAVLSTGDTLDYALGIGVVRRKGYTVLTHGGADIAHRAHVLIFPELDGGVFAMSNNSGYNPQLMTREIAGMFFPELRIDEEKASPADNEQSSESEEAASADTTAFDRVVGRYAFRDAPLEIEYTREGTTFYAQATGQPRIQLNMLSASEYAYQGVPGATVTFHLPPEGQADSATHHQNGDYKIIRKDAFTLDAEMLQEYEGLYFSKELDVVLHCVYEEDTLRLRRTRMEDILLSAEEKDAFTGGRVYGSVRFDRNSDGVLRGFSVSNARTKNVRFQKLR